MMESDRLVGLEDYARAARAALPEAAAAYLDGGAGDGLSVRENAAAWSRIGLIPRHMRGGGGTAAIRLFGRAMAHPILVAPMAFHGLFHPEAERATALAAAAQQAMFVVSCQSGTAVEDIARAAPAPRWFQLYLQADRRATLALLARAQAAGAEALVVTLDAPLSGVRDRERRAGFRLPDHIRPVMLEGLPQPALAPLGDGESAVFDRVMPLAPTWDDLAWLRGQTRLPLLAKGILSPDDAWRAMAAGCDGLIVSNHGGRVLDTTPAPAAVLPGIVQAVGPQVPVLVDGGIRRGTDVVKALALGAHAVLVGRPVLHGLAVGGAQGASHVLRLIRDEFEIAMALCGCRSVGEITPDLLAPFPYLNR